MRIVKKASAIVRDDIRSTIYECDVYPKPDSLSVSSDLLPDTLQTLLQGIVAPSQRGQNIQANQRRVTAIGQSLISSCRPRSFLSPVLLSVAVYIHRKFASRELIDILNGLMFSSSYREVQQYVHSVMISKGPSPRLANFTQFVFDNADCNVRTLDGKNTFHSMGGIACITPSRDHTEESPIKRLTGDHSNIGSGEFGYIPLKGYSKPSKSGLDEIVMKDLSTLGESDPKNLKLAKTVDSLWSLTHVLRVPCPSWAGYMHIVTSSDDYETSDVEILPFINFDPSNPSTIYTALMFAQTECEKQGLNVCPVTFDQPLYIKAVEIVSSSDKLTKVFVRLGGFHMIMSYLGAIGSIMTGSGLDELWRTVYAGGSIHHLISGHAYSRAVRAHLLSQIAITKLVFEESRTLDNIDCTEVNEIFCGLARGDCTTADAVNQESVNHLLSKLHELLQNASVGRTGKLWVQYYEQIGLLQLFLRAERTGDWELHTYCVRNMIPVFHAGGHFAYAKSSHLYLQQMNELTEIMQQDDLKLFTEKGYFTIRRSDKFWDGIYSDQTIEQCLMRMFKLPGGLTHGRGITDSTVAKWVHGLPLCLPICNALENFVHVHTGHGEQHRDLRQSSQLTDANDITKLLNWLRVHSPFQNRDPLQLVSIATGLVADETVNCDQVRKIGECCVSNVVSKTFNSIKLRRVDTVKSFASMANSIKVRGSKVVIDPTILFNRITCVIQSQAEMEEYLKYELAPKPTALFDSAGMRKTQKSTLGKILKTYGSEQTKIPEHSLFVVDGGFLLRAVVWPKQSSYKDICTSYSNYLVRHFGANVVVVFDGYACTMSTKGMEQARRSKDRYSIDINISPELPATTPQSDFLANAKNKTQLIDLLMQELSAINIQSKQAEADADVLIAETALDIAQDDNNVVVVGTDTDLLVILTSRVQPGCNIHMMYSITQNLLVSVSEIATKMGDHRSNLLVAHSISGCDTTSALFRVGKKKVFSTIVSDVTSDSQQYVNTILADDSTPSAVAAAGEQLLLILYGSKTVSSLDQYRYVTYKRYVAKSKLNKPIDLASLPPSSDAAQQHVYRCYLQVQQWLGTSLPPTDWGWSLDNGLLVPTAATKPCAPDNLLNLISCGCKSACTKRCGCKKAGLSCSGLCNCSSDSCNNHRNTVLSEISEFDE